jgi:hypothetical protein
LRRGALNPAKAQKQYTSHKRTQNHREKSPMEPSS